jgi:hypothetical protein
MSMTESKKDTFTGIHSGSYYFTVHVCNKTGTIIISWQAYRQYKEKRSTNQFVAYEYFDFLSNIEIDK